MVVSQALARPPGKSTLKGGGYLKINEHKMISPEDLELYLAMGWKVATQRLFKMHGRWVTMSYTVYW